MTKAKTEPRKRIPVLPPPPNFLRDQDSPLKVEEDVKKRSVSGSFINQVAPSSELAREEISSLPQYRSIYFDAETGNSYYEDFIKTPFRFHPATGIRLSNDFGTQRIILNPLNFPTIDSVNFVVDNYILPLLENDQELTIFDANENIGENPSGKPNFPDYYIRIQFMQNAVEYDVTDLIGRIMANRYSNTAIRGWFETQLRMDKVIL